MQTTFPIKHSAWRPYRRTNDGPGGPGQVAHVGAGLLVVDYAVASDSPEL